eukprot:CCRYP_015428-RB/>CCRYP_015428-RB protein AED:0.49 eAED:0.49 QI:0/-1/0/1/-1/0/1/0/25
MQTTGQSTIPLHTTKTPGANSSHHN